MTVQDGERDGLETALAAVHVMMSRQSVALRTAAAAERQRNEAKESSVRVTSTPSSLRLLENQLFLVVSALTITQKLYLPSEQLLPRRDLRQ